jgi:hypothetical protein
VRDCAKATVPPCETLALRLYEEGPLVKWWLLSVGQGPRVGRCCGAVLMSLWPARREGSGEIGLFARGRMSKGGDLCRQTSRLLRNRLLQLATLRPPRLPTLKPLLIHLGQSALATVRLDVAMRAFAKRLRIPVLSQNTLISPRKKAFLCRASADGLLGGAWLPTTVPSCPPIEGNR